MDVKKKEMYMERIMDLAFNCIIVPSPYPDFNPMDNAEFDKKFKEELSKILDEMKGE